MRAIATGYHDNLDQLRGALEALEVRLHRQVLRWRATHHEHATLDELLGLYISEHDVDRLLDDRHPAGAPGQTDTGQRSPLTALAEALAEADADHAARTDVALVCGVQLRLPLLAERLGLNAFEQQVVLLTLAPEIDRRYERLFGYLNDDVTRRWPTVSLALQLFCEDDEAWLAGRAAFADDAPLRALRVVQLSDAAGSLPPPLLGRGLRLDDRVVGFLLEVDGANPGLGDLLCLHPRLDGPLPLAPDVAAQVDILGNYLASPPMPAPLVAVTGPDGALLLDVAAHLSVY